MLNWRNVKIDGNPVNVNGKYLVTDSKDISTSGINGVVWYGGSEAKFTFMGWTGDDNTYEDNSCCSGEKCFDMDVKYWCPVEEIELPK